MTAVLTAVTAMGRESRVGKALVSSSFIDGVAAARKRKLIEVPVGFNGSLVDKSDWRLKSDDEE